MKPRGDPPPPAHVHIAATSGDLETVRKIVIRELLAKPGCLAVEQKGYPSGYSEAEEMLEIQIGTCDAVIHLVGCRYGGEPDPTTLPPDAHRRSYAQMEADIARKLGVPLLILVCTEDFPYDPCHAETKKRTTLQRAYREEVAVFLRPHAWVADGNEAAQKVREMRLGPVGTGKPASGGGRRKLIVAGAGVLLAALLAGLAGTLWWNWKVRHARAAAEHPSIERPAPQPAVQQPPEETGTFDAARVRANVIWNIEEREKEEIGKMDSALDWGRIAEWEKGRDQELVNTDRFLDQMGGAFKENETSANYRDAARILGERGVADALRFLEAKGDERETKIDALKGGDQPQGPAMREALREKLFTVALLELDLEFERAEAECRSAASQGGDWAEPRNQLARLLIQDGERIDSAEGDHKLQEAVILCHGTLEKSGLEPSSPAWAESEDHLGEALWNRGVRLGGVKGAGLLAGAVEAYRAVLLVRVPGQMPEAWAETERRLADALADQGRSADGGEGTRLLAEAAVAYRAALVVITRERAPQAWATTQINLGNALSDLGVRAPGDDGLRRLDEAVQAYRAALEVMTPGHDPDAWASAQDRLAGALAGEGARRGGEEGARLLADAAAAYRATLEIHTRERMPLLWAAAENDLGNALWRQSLLTKGENGRRLVAAAVEAYRLALQVHLRGELPLAWASTQNNLANVLADQGRNTEGEEGKRLLAEAVEDVRATLEVRTREQVPEAWASSQNNLGNILLTEGRRDAGGDGKRRLAEAVAAYRSALEIYTREQAPQAWALSRKNLKDALEELGKRTEGGEGKRLRAEAESIGRELDAAK